MVAFEDGINEEPKGLNSKATAMVIVATIKTLGELATELVRRGAECQMIYDMVYKLALDRTGDDRKANAFTSLMAHEISMNLLNIPLLTKEDTDKIFDILFDY